jgi:hypothetical protein
MIIHFLNHVIVINEEWFATFMLKKRFFKSYRFFKTRLIMIMSVGVRLTSQNRSHQQACCSSPWWYVSVESHGNDYAVCGKTPESPPELSGNPTGRDIWERVAGTDDGVGILCISIWDMSMDLKHTLKSYNMGPPALIPIRRNVCCPFLSPLKIHHLSQVLTDDPWVQWQAH